MNLVDCYVTCVLSEPWSSYGKWLVLVEYNCYGHITTTELMVSSEEEALAVSPGYHFLA